MPQTDMVIGIGIVAFIFFYCSFKFNELRDEQGNQKHTILQYLFFVLGMVTLLLIPAIYVNFDSDCEKVVANTTAINNATTSYEYKNFCTTKETTIPITFMKIVNIWALRLVTTYFLLYLAWVFIILPWIKKRKERFGK